jgi:HAD superfamily hydrolase (TIGR01549 family)
MIRAQTQKDLEELTNPYSEIIWDLDDTIYSLHDYDTGAFEVLCRDILKLDDFDTMVQWLLKNKAEKGVHYRYLFNDFLEYAGQPQDVLRKCIESYDNYDCCNLQPSHSLMPFLKKLQDRNKKQFIVTNGRKERQRRKMKALGLNDLIEDVYIADPTDKNVRLKPEPEGFYTLQKKHHIVKPIMIGDNTDIDGAFANNAGIPFINFRFTRN